jgi:hypothetical protein
MSDTSSLTQLAKFVGQSALSSSDPREQRRVIDSITGNLAAKLQRRSVGELLGAVLALSARTRRMVMPHVGIDLDVFTPGGKRAVKVVMPQRG